jgi:hypothetical protein
MYIAEQSRSKQAGISKRASERATTRKTKENTLGGSMYHIRRQMQV